jgi:ABC-type multidrug transport system fused ATPase/permease subunit
MLEGLRPSRTFVLIAHRPSALRHCDVIHELKDGRIVSSSSHTEFYPQLRARTVNVK